MDKGTYDDGKKREIVGCGSWLWTTTKCMKGVEGNQILPLPFF